MNECLHLELRYFCVGPEDEVVVHLIQLSEGFARVLSKARRGFVREGEHVARLGVRITQIENGAAIEVLAELPLLEQCDG